ncbi:MAG: penicillin acylase family protein [Verrucomicrobia bacterium]|nr:penicillin acylase family protein [Verrucomicrobiota bacterium]
MSTSKKKARQPSTDQANGTKSLPIRLGLNRLLVFVGVLGLGFVACAILVWLTLAGSLPREDGTLHVSGIGSPVEIRRDRFGIPTISAVDRKDAAFGTGFVHAQDRFFQMDTLRRKSAGELAELFGAIALPLDRSAAVHRFRLKCTQDFQSLPSDQQAILISYAAGVNAGLAELKAMPFEYYLLGMRPRPWRPEDSLLIVYTMALDLQGTAENTELSENALKRVLPEKAFQFFAPSKSTWDVPLDPEPSVTPAPIPNGFRVADLPASNTYAENRSESGGKNACFFSVARPDRYEGSNAWAVGPTRTEDRHTIVANDPHLVLRVPNIWYRLALSWPVGDAANYVCGVTIPGAPPIVIGSNGHVAWGLTNASIDSDDVVLVDVKKADPDFYRTAAGWEQFEKISVPINVKGSSPENAQFLQTIWGPVRGADLDGRLRVLHSVIDQPGVVNLNRLAIECSASVHEAMEIAKRSGIPAQNFVVADTSGGIGWTVMGPIPRRSGFDGRLPLVWADGSQHWDGWLGFGEYPERSNLPFIWSANNRMVNGPDLAKLGDGGYDRGARATQVHDDLARCLSANYHDMLAIQTDINAVFLNRWYDQLASVLSAPRAALNTAREEFRGQLHGWSRQADASSIAYRLTREYRNEVAVRSFEPLTKLARTVYPDFDYTDLNYEDPLWSMVTAKPKNLLSSRYSNWEELFLDAVDAVIRTVKPIGYQHFTVGDRNETRIQHPMSGALGVFGNLLNMAADRLPGDRYDMPRIQGSAFGASLRMAVSPGHEQKGYLVMPCGQSGNPISSHYRDLHAAWVADRPMPFLPGPEMHHLSLIP